MHETSTFSYQLAEYKAMQKLNKLMHRTLFWVYMSDENQRKMNNEHWLAERSSYPTLRVVHLEFAEKYGASFNFCTDRLKQAQTDLKNHLIELEQINKVVS
jgi:hypothetical protein